MVPTPLESKRDFVSSIITAVNLCFTIGIVYMIYRVQHPNEYCRMRNDVIDVDIVTAFIMYGGFLIGVTIFSAIYTLIFSAIYTLIPRFQDVGWTLYLGIIVLCELFVITWLTMIAYILLDFNNCNIEFYQLYIFIWVIFIIKCGTYSHLRDIYVEA